jgi:pimeloyl-ACP methyl ester carboxylesterase
MSDKDPPRDPKNRARKLSEELRGATKLFVDATKSVTGVVQEMHETIGGGPMILGRPFAPFVRIFSGPVYASIKGITDLVGVGLDAVLAELAPVFDHATSTREMDAVRGALNGVLGDHLARTQNPLSIEMELRAHDRTLVLEREALSASIPDATGRVVVLVHGSAMDDALFTRNAHNHGTHLQRELGFTPVYVRYNSGLHVSENGRALDPLLEALVENWPTEIEAFVIVGFSMGGLVTRSAVHIADGQRRRWREKLKAIVFLGTPHHGAPLERAGNVVDALLDVSRYSSPIGKLAQIRSAGVTDLRYGLVLDEHWQGKDRFALERDPRTSCALPDDVPCFAVAGSMSAEGPGSLRAAHVPPTKHGLAGDGLVEVDSGLGRHVNAALDLHFPLTHQLVVMNKRHLDLLDSEEVADAIVGFIGPLVVDKHAS